MWNRPGRGPFGAGALDQQCLSGRPSAEGRRRDRRAFSLVELLVCLLVIGVLLALLLPALKSSRETSRAVVCLTRLRSLHLCTRVYGDDYRSLPVSPPDRPVKAFELSDKEWRCPSDLPVRVGHTSYEYVAPIYMDPPPGPLDLSKLKPKSGLRKYENNPALPLFWDREPRHHSKRNVVYWNGSAGVKDW